MNTLRKYTHAR